MAEETTKKKSSGGTRKSSGTSTSRSKSKSAATGTKTTSAGSKSTSSRAKSSTGSSTKRSTSSRSKKTSPVNEIKEEVEVAGTELVDRVKGLIEEGNVRRLTIRNSEGHAIVEIPVSTAIGGGVAAVVLAGLGGMAAMLVRARIDVWREKLEELLDQAQEMASGENRESR